jgi:WD domain, G-beta repeat
VTIWEVTQDWQDPERNKYSFQLYTDDTYIKDTSGLATNVMLHQDAITCLAFRPESHYDDVLDRCSVLATGSTDQTLRLWNFRVSPQRREIYREEHEDVVTAVAFSPDGRTMVSSDRGGVVRIWKLRESNECHFTDDTRVVLASISLEMGDATTGRSIPFCIEFFPQSKVGHSFDGNVLREYRVAIGTSDSLIIADVRLTTIPKKEKSVNFIEYTTPIEEHPEAAAIVKKRRRKKWSQVNATGSGHVPGDDFKKNENVGLSISEWHLDDSWDIDAQAAKDAASNTYYIDMIIRQRFEEQFQDTGIASVSVSVHQQFDEKLDDFSADDAGCWVIQTGAWKHVPLRNPYDPKFFPVNVFVLEAIKYGDHNLRLRDTKQGAVKTAEMLQHRGVVTAVVAPGNRLRKTFIDGQFLSGALNENFIITGSFDESVRISKLRFQSVVHNDETFWQPIGTVDQSIVLERPLTDFKAGSILAMDEELRRKETRLAMIRGEMAPDTEFLDELEHGDTDLNDLMAQAAATANVAVHSAASTKSAKSSAAAAPAAVSAPKRGKAVIQGALALFQLAGRAQKEVAAGQGSDVTELFVDELHRKGRGPGISAADASAPKTVVGVSSRHVNDPGGLAANRTSETRGSLYTFQLTAKRISGPG